jgi:acetyltransferase-like isoleucine patch superfamily enzyme
VVDTLVPPLRRLLELMRTDPVATARRLQALVRAQVAFRDCERGERIYAFGKVRVVREGRIAIGSRVSFIGGMLSTELLSHEGAELSLGDDSGFNYGVSIEAHQSVRVGRRCMFASLVRVCDRGHDKVSPILIGDDVWLAHGVIVEPGVTIGDGSVVSAGSVVTRDVPPGSLAAGNPARSMSLSLVPSERPQGGAAGGSSRHP